MKTKKKLRYNDRILRTTSLRTSEKWWKDVSRNKSKMIDWLKNQYHGEFTAEKRVRDLIKQYNLSGDAERIINKIADDEKKHADWVKQLLLDRGIEAKVLQKEERYWNKTIPKQNYSFEYICAVGFLAESMRLKRIKVLSNAKYKDIADVFSKIFNDETFHVHYFKQLSTPDAINEAYKNHKEGMNALGLVA